MQYAFYVIHVYIFIYIYSFTCKHNVNIPNAPMHVFANDKTRF